MVFVLCNVYVLKVHPWKSDLKLKIDGNESGSKKLTHCDRVNVFGLCEPEIEMSFKKIEELRHVFLLINT